MRPNKLTPGYNLRWESSRMMLPEHKIALIERKRQQGLKEKPILDEQALEELNQTICNTTAANRWVRFKYYQQGKFLFVTGKVAQYDALYKQLRIRDRQGEIYLLNIKDILKVEME